VDNLVGRNEPFGLMTANSALHIGVATASKSPENRRSCLFAQRSIPAAYFRPPRKGACEPITREVRCGIRHNTNVIRKSGYTFFIRDICCGSCCSRAAILTVSDRWTVHDFLKTGRLAVQPRRHPRCLARHHWARASSCCREEQMAEPIANDWKAISDRMQQIQAERSPSSRRCPQCEGRGWIPEYVGGRHAAAAIVVCDFCRNPENHPLPSWNMIKVKPRVRDGA
jgi:hypothetical protein